jgi:hypothetical protein
MNHKPKTKTRLSSGSALILTVVLTSLLAIVGVMFVMVARVNKISTSAISENKGLDFAVETVIATIAQQLVLDTPGVADPNDPNDEYYDYPDANNAWLASLEPYEYDTNDYRWWQISDVTGYIKDRELWWGSTNARQDVYVEPPDRTVIREYPEIKLDSDGRFLDVDDNVLTEGLLADADGDGIADAKWIELDDITTSKGKPIYAAIRVIDNSAMLNVNTAYKFDSLSPEEKEIDGSSQMQINLDELAIDINGVEDLHTERCGSNDYLNLTWDDFSNGMIWRIESAAGGYWPFDISDELELRYRYCVSAPAQSRLENTWDETIAHSGKLYDATGGRGLDDWYSWILDVNDTEGDRRHLVTAYNIDRVIDADGEKMVNVNRINPVAEPNIGTLYDAILAGIYDANDANISDPQAVAAQLAVNIKDFSDDDSEVSTLGEAYGFERPCVFISELVYKLVKTKIIPPGGPVDANVYEKHWSYGIELRKRHRGTNVDDWQIVINGPNTIERNVPVADFGQDASRYRVVLFQDPNAELESIVVYSDSPDNGETGVDPNVTLRWDRLPLEYFADPNSENYSYDVYFGTDYNDVRDANNESGLWAEYQGRQDYYSNSYDPYGPNVPMDTNTTYYWRIDDIYDNNDKNIIETSGVWNFTTWATEPNEVNEVIGPNDIIFDGNSTIELQRNSYPVDLVEVPPWLVEDLPADGNVVRSFQRDMTSNRWIKRIWDTDHASSLGHRNNFASGSEPIQVRFGKFNNIGEIGMAFMTNVYGNEDGIPQDADGLEEKDIRLNLAETSFQQLFKYLTVFDPGRHSGNDPNETRIKGRININTAPWYVIAQLPWVSKREDGYDSKSLAKAIVEYRDKTSTSVYFDRPGQPGFENIGQLNNIVDGNDESSIDYYWRADGGAAGDQRGFPDLTTGSRTRLDGVPDDFEERDLIFSRISDLVTVRSDVFTAYILVRIGTDGPQKRVVAILDRSGVRPDGAGSTIGDVKIVALHPVPDPR